jgi:pimeloyl-ACP methyl ester carboxylesterase
MTNSNLKIIILHGWSLESELLARWRPIIKLLTTANFDVEYLSLPGFDQPLQEPWTLNHFRDYVLAQLPANQPFVLLGHSFGGQLAVRIAAEQPTNLKAMVLIGPAGIIDRTILKILKRTLFRLIAKTGKFTSFFFSKAATNYLENRARRMLYRTARATDYYQASQLLRETMTQVIKDEVIEDLPQVKVPTLLIWGDRDRFTPVRNAAQFVTRLPSAQLKLLSNEGHRPYFTQSHQVAKIIINFLKRHVV